MAECLLSIPELLSRLLRGEAPCATETPIPGGTSEPPKKGDPPAADGSVSEQQDESKEPNTPKSLEPGSKALKSARSRRSRTTRKGPDKNPSSRETPGTGQGSQEGTQKPQARKREKHYKCPKCQRKFLGRVALTAHRRLHVRKWPRLSPQNAGRSSSHPPPDLAVPQEGHPGTGASSPFPCAPGEGPLPFWSEMALHQQGPAAAAHGFNPWALGYGPQPLPGHQAPGLHGNGEFICDQCGWSFHGWEELVTHQMAHMAAEGIAGSGHSSKWSRGKGRRKKRLFPTVRKEDIFSSMAKNDSGPEDASKGCAGGRGLLSGKGFSPQRRAKWGQDGRWDVRQPGAHPARDAKGLEEAVASLMANGLDVFRQPDPSDPQNDSDGQPVLIVEPGTRPQALP
ncbi:hypothetical protein JD844_003863 [Phrynosoma platyrhinos]|uniref:C2H2-type domain-containing protein n=1 Tax=Phrynosoma platyrhinos TaxID=52577 RepID=A0ABQ7TDZ2_PHRPL|nr:hypothetical protein JD844_003863 [Phrynosoma platyrhinos]